MLIFLNCLQEAYQALFGDEEEIGASDRLSEAANALSGAAESDDSLLALSERITDLAYQVEDAAGEVSRALQEMTHNPGQLDEIEERLDLIQKLKRKYGNTIEEILQFLSNAQEELDRLNFSDERIQQLQEQESEKLQETRN